MFEKTKRCWKCGRFLGEKEWATYYIDKSWFGLRKKYRCYPGCLPSGRPAEKKSR